MVHQRNRKILAQSGHWMNFQVLLMHQDSSRSSIKLHSTELKRNISFWIQETNLGFSQSNAPLTTMKTLWRPPGEITFCQSVLTGRKMTYRLLPEFEVRTVSYGSSFYFFIAHTRSVRAMNRRGKKRLSVAYSTCRTDKVSKYKIFITCLLFI